MDPLTAKLASLRLAPVQAASWGHPECTGLPTMDLYISGEALEPLNASDNYSEKLVRLPNLGVHVEPLAPAISKPGLGSLNLPSNEPLLLCAGAPFKYSPIDDDVWVQIARHLRKRIFKRKSGGRLIFFRSRSEAMDRILETRLRTAFEKGGVEFDAHVSIVPTLDRSRFFGLMRESALMLDTLGFSGFNTAIQGIECDLPVLAYEGAFMRGRLASAIMRRLDLPELVATTKEEFVQKAIELAGDARRRRSLRAKIIERRSILFHDLEPVRALERHLTDEVMKARTTTLA
jgi:predicted O-linked N-acetylglucosamine transferase (SPINDLY family)